jgi:hypothetical protein
MQGIAQAFADGGPFMFVILLLGLGLVAMTIVQFVRVSRTNLVPLLWGLLVALLLTGALGTVMGVAQGFDALASAAPEARASMMAMVIAIAINTSALALLFAVPLSIAIGLASFLVKRAQRRARSAQ